MAKQIDDLEAVRNLVATLEPFEANDRERIIKWAREKLGMGTVGVALPIPPAAASHAATISAVPAATARRVSGPAARDIKSFVVEKRPKTDIQLAAVVAYYYAFEASEADRKETIKADDLLDACRKVNRKRPGDAPQTLRNTCNAGYLDKTDELGTFRINSVGENLVAMVLPKGTSAKIAEKPKRPRKAKATTKIKRAAKKRNDSRKI